MNVAIIEDEPLAAEKLQRYLSKCDSSITISTVLNSLETAIPWIRENHETIDLYFMDVQLTDGLSFEIFNSVTINKPVIFTTAFDEFAVDAFKVNSIDYLLKPVTFTDLSRALKKLKTLEQQFSNADQMAPIIAGMSKKSYKDRFLIRIGNHLRSILTNDISAFYAEGRDVCLINAEGKEYPVEYTIDTLKDLLDPKEFFRVNRSYLVSLNAIVDVVVYSNRRLKLSLKNSADHDIVVSREKVADFKQWFEGN